MFPGELVDHVARELRVTTALAENRSGSLRKASLLGTNGRGLAAARMSSNDATNLLLAVALEHGRGGDVAEAVRRFRGLEIDGDPTSLPWNFTGGLTCFGARSAGKALDWILEDFRHGRCHEWAAGEEFDLSATLTTAGTSLFVSLRKRTIGQTGVRAAIAGYGVLPPESDRRVERQVTFRAAVFRDLAIALGPPPSPAR